jgi:hypothetical protein
VDCNGAPANSPHFSMAGVKRDRPSWGAGEDASEVDEKRARTDVPSWSGSGATTNVLSSGLLSLDDYDDLLEPLSAEGGGSGSAPRGARAAEEAPAPRGGAPASGAWQVGAGVGEEGEIEMGTIPGEGNVEAYGRASGGVLRNPVRRVVGGRPLGARAPGRDAARGGELTRDGGRLRFDVDRLARVVEFFKENEPAEVGEHKRARRVRIVSSQTAASVPHRDAKLMGRDERMQEKEQFTKRIAQLLALMGPTGGGIGAAAGPAALRPIVSLKEHPPRAVPNVPAAPAPQPWAQMLAGRRAVFPARRPMSLEACPPEADLDVGRAYVNYDSLAEARPQFILGNLPHKGPLPIPALSPGLAERKQGGGGVAAAGVVLSASASILPLPSTLSSSALPSSSSSSSSSSAAATAPSGSASSLSAIFQRAAPALPVSAPPPRVTGVYGVPSRAAGSMPGLPTMSGMPVPGMSVPGMQVPGMSVPGMSVPGMSVPGMSVPSTAAYSAPTVPSMMMPAASAAGMSGAGPATAPTSMATSVAPLSSAGGGAPSLHHVHGVGAAGSGGVGVGAGVGMGGGRPAAPAGGGLLGPPPQMPQYAPMMMAPHSHQQPVPPGALHAPPPPYVHRPATAAGPAAAAHWWLMPPERLPPPRNTPRVSKRCIFYPSLLGCRWRDECHFIHDPNFVPQVCPTPVIDAVRAGQLPLPPGVTIDMVNATPHRSFA